MKEPIEIVEAMGSFYRGRKVILVGQPLSQYARQIEALHAAGAQRPFVVASGPGPGPAPQPPVEHYMVRLSTASHTETSRSTEALLTDPPAALRAALDAYDPERTALVLCEANINVAEFCGRRIADAQPAVLARIADWEEEDRLWATVGVSRPPSSVVRAEAVELARAHEQHNLGHGTLWRADPRAGMHVAMEQTRLVNDPAEFARAAAWAQSHSERIQVSSFVEGIPVALNGFVLADGTAVLRPYEELLFRQGEHLRFAGCSTHFDPSLGDRDHLRGLVADVGAYLFSTFGFRGAFHVSGLLGSAGFVPHALVPRAGSAMGLMTRFLPYLPLMQAVIVHGNDTKLRAADLEMALLERLESQRCAAIAMHTLVKPDQDVRTLWLVRGENTVRAARGSDHSDACLVHSRTEGDGALVALIAGPSFAGLGECVAPLVSQAFALADERWGTGIGALTPAARSH
ncbi:hypothetical protein RPQ02_28405 [Streptomyces sp. AM2-3-1]|uniref:hypothetical protein n=1 Tax=Streptomyces sp. AM2-3-1 TaxID=3075824 RepID=UPI0028C3CBF1|nr:hypothetical protein [Streptomyces sp. AM2-3-1]WNO67456.1 hypothetical protein RPQ02_28405 [Streptomyces sp. AM2-3-1]